MVIQGSTILVTGGASFIGSHLVDELYHRGAKMVRVIDNLSTGKLEWINRKSAFYIEDLLDSSNEYLFDGVDIVFHLAAYHGGRATIDFYPSEVCQGFAINDNVVRACHKYGVKKLVFSSSVCVYPLALQVGTHKPLEETEAGIERGTYAPDGVYGLTKLAMEVEMKTYFKQYGLPSAIARFSTVYGPRMNDTHAMMALINRALKKEDPYLVWGNGHQGRDWLWVGDAVNALIHLAEWEESAESYNIVSSNTITIRDLIKNIFEIVGWEPKEIIYDISKPVGPKWRSVSPKKLHDLGYKPRHDFIDGLKETIEYAKKQL